MIATRSPTLIVRSTSYSTARPAWPADALHNSTNAGTASASVQEVGYLADLLNGIVVGILGRDELRASELIEDSLIVDGEQRRAQLLLEPRAVGLVDVAAHRPLIVGEGRRFPDHDDLRRIDLAGSLVEVPNGEVEHADLEGAGLHQLDRPTVVAGEPDACKDFVGTTPERIADEILRHQTTGGRGARPEGERFARDLLRELLGWDEAGLGVGNDERFERHVLRTLRDRLRARHLAASLHAGEAAEPSQLHLAVGERSHRSGVAFHRQVLHRHAKLAPEIFGDAREAFDESSFILVGYCREHKDRFVLRESRAAEQRNRKRQRRYSPFHRQLPLVVTKIIDKPARPDGSSKSGRHRITCLSGPLQPVTSRPIRSPVPALA